MTQKMKVAFETADYVVIQVRPKPGRDFVQWRGQVPPGPGPRTCWCCGFTWVLEPGGEDMCPRCGRPNAIKEQEPMNVRYVFKEQPQHDSSPEIELGRSKDLLRPQGETRLTVGDLSTVTEKRRKEDQRWNNKRVNLEGGLSIGDLYEGRRLGDFKPHVSESQQIINEHIRKFKEKTYKKFLLKNAMYEEDH